MKSYCHCNSNECVVAFEWRSFSSVQLNDAPLFVTLFIFCLESCCDLLCFSLDWLELAWFVEYIMRTHCRNKKKCETTSLLVKESLNTSNGRRNINSCHSFAKSTFTTVELNASDLSPFSNKTNKKPFFQLVMRTVSVRCTEWIFNFAGTFHLLFFKQVFKFRKKNSNGNVNEFYQVFDSASALVFYFCYSISFRCFLNILIDRSFELEHFRIALFGVYIHYEWWYFLVLLRMK